MRVVQRLADALVGERRLGGVDPEGHRARGRHGERADDLHLVGRHVGDDVHLAPLQGRQPREVVGDRLPDDPLDRGRLAAPAPPFPVGLHHQPVVLHPLDESVGAGADGLAGQLLGALVAGEARRIDVAAHLRHAHRHQRIGLLGGDAEGRGVDDLRPPRWSRSRTVTTVLPRHEVALVDGLHVLGRERRAVVELHARPRGVTSQVVSLTALPGAWPGRAGA